MEIGRITEIDVSQGIIDIREYIRGAAGVFSLYFKEKFASEILSFFLVKRENFESKWCILS